MISPFLTILKTITATRIGIGQAADIIDLPIMRDSSTNWPIIPGSTTKGVNKAKETIATEQVDGGTIEALFGSAKGIGSLNFSDHQPVLFPVRSWFGVYALVTCPLAFEKLEVNFELAGGVIPDTYRPNELLETSMAIDECLCSGDSLLLGETRPNRHQVVLNEFDLTPTNDDFQGQFGSIARVFCALGLCTLADCRRLLIVNDTLFTFLTEQCTEVRTRTALEVATKSVRDGSLRTEEYLPPLTCLTGFSRLPQEMASRQILQVGAGESIGAGMVRWSGTSMDSFNTAIEALEQGAGAEQ
jgi:CRISPR-associated protein Cmr4